MSLNYLWFWHFVNSCDRNSSVFGMSWWLSYGIYHLDFSLDFFFWTLLIDHFWHFFGWKLPWSQFWTCQFLIFNINTTSWFLGFLRFFKSFYRAVDKLILDSILIFHFGMYNFEHMDFYFWLIMIPKIMSSHAVVVLVLFFHL